MSQNYSQRMKDSIQEFLENDNRPFRVDEETGVFDFDLNMQGKLRSIRYLLDVDEDSFVVYAMCPLRADNEDEKMMANMAKFLCMANYELRSGNFEMNIESGEIRCKCFVACEDMDLSQAVIRSSIYAPAEMYNYYETGIIQILVNNMTAEAAIRLCGGDFSSGQQAPEAVQAEGKEEDRDSRLEEELKKIRELLEDKNAAGSTGREEAGRRMPKKEEFDKDEFEDDEFEKDEFDDDEFGSGEAGDDEFGGGFDKDEFDDDEFGGGEAGDDESEDDDEFGGSGSDEFDSGAFEKDEFDDDDEDEEEF